MGGSAIVPPQSTPHKFFSSKNMDSIITTLVEYLNPTALTLLFIVLWQFKEGHQKDKKYHDLFLVLNNHTDAINRFLGVLEGQRRTAP